MLTKSLMVMEVTKKTCNGKSRNRIEMSSLNLTLFGLNYLICRRGGDLKV